MKFKRRTVQVGVPFLLLPFLLFFSFAQRPEDNPDIFGDKSEESASRNDKSSKDSEALAGSEARVIYSKPGMERFAIRGESFLIPREDVHLGDDIRYIVQVSWEGKLGEMEVDEPDTPLLNNLRLMKVIPSNKISPETNRAIAEFIYLMEAMEKGKSYIGMIDANYRLKDGSGQGTLRIKEQRFEVKPKRYNVKRAGLIGLAILGGLGGVALLGFGALYIMRRPPAREPEPDSDVSTPYERILGELSSMRLFLIEGEIRDFYAKLTKLAKGFIAVTHGEELTRKTTDELLLSLQEKECDPEQRDRLFSLLELCDRVKFAGYIPTHSENEQALKNLEAIIRNEMKR